MKHRIKLFLTSVLMVLSLALLSACGSSSTDTTEPLDPTVKQNLESACQEYMENLGQMSEDTIQTQIDAAYKQKDAIIYNGLTNYKNDLEKLGEFQKVDSVTVEKTEDGYSAHIASTYSKRKLKFTLGLSDQDQSITEMTFEPEYSLVEELEDAGGNLILGMGTVFLILIFLSWVISLFKYIYLWQKKSEEKAKAAKETAPAPAPMPVAEAEEKISGDELQAVIAAAIAAYEADTSNGFVPGPSLDNGLVVRSIRRR